MTGIRTSLGAAAFAVALAAAGSAQAEARGVFGALGRPQQNAASTTQAGTGNAAAVVQNGQGNTAAVRQFGDDNAAAINQSGNGNTACVLQVGRGLDANVVQTGGQSVSVIQTARGARDMPLQRCMRARRIDPAVLTAMIGARR